MIRFKEEVAMETQSFREAYDVLQRHAAALRQQDEPNIDDLLNIVNESVAAYKTCKQRIDAVEKALEEALESAGLDEPSRAGRSSGSAPAASPVREGRSVPERQSDPMDDDVPF
jgi:exodeoxyribonuclease VII small subunit